MGIFEIAKYRFPLKPITHLWIPYWHFLIHQSRWQMYMHQAVHHERWTYDSGSWLDSPIWSVKQTIELIMNDRTCSMLFVHAVLDQAKYQAWFWCINNTFKQIFMQEGFICILPMKGRNTIPFTCWQPWRPLLLPWIPSEDGAWACASGMKPQLCRRPMHLLVLAPKQKIFYIALWKWWNFYSAWRTPIC